MAALLAPGGDSPQAVHLLAIDQEVDDDRPLAALRIVRVVRTYLLADLAARKSRRPAAVGRAQEAAEDAASATALAAFLSAPRSVRSI
jgi:hypothetical protein